MFENDATAVCENLTAEVSRAIRNAHLAYKTTLLLYSPGMIEGRFEAHLPENSSAAAL